MTVTTAADILRHAAAFIAERGWSPFDADGAVCIYSAVGLATTGHAIDAFETLDLGVIDGPCFFVDRAIGILGQPVTRPGEPVGIAHWEMLKGRTKGHVLAVMETAVKLAREAETGRAA